MLKIIFESGEFRQELTATDGHRAVSTAMRLIALRDQLEPGDKLTVEDASGSSPQTS